MASTRPSRWIGRSSRYRDPPTADADDFVLGELPSGTVTIPAGSNGADIDGIAIAGDTDFEGRQPEDFRVSLTDPTSGETLAVATGRIENDDTLPLPSDESLEYFARVTAFQKGAVYEEFADGSPVPEAHEISDGYQIEQEFLGRTFNNSFYAVLLEADNRAPVLAIRGTSSDLLDRPVETAWDWLANADPRGVGFGEVDAVWADLEAVFENNENVSIVGHSQGGAQAQIIAARAEANGFDVGKVHTFNSAGVTVGPSAVPKNTLSTAESVRHYVSAGDVVSQAGETFLEGEVEYYDFDALNPIRPLQYVGSTHVGHWSQGVLYEELNDPAIYDPKYVVLKKPAGYDTPAGTLPFDYFQSAEYSHQDAGLFFDEEFFAFRFALALLPSFHANDDFNNPQLFDFFDEEIFNILKNRDGVENLRKDVSPIVDEFLLLLAQEAAIELPFAIGRQIQTIVEVSARWGAEKAIIAADFTADQIFALRDLRNEAWRATIDWSADQFEQLFGGENAPLVLTAPDGGSVTHSGSTPAVLQGQIDAPNDLIGAGGADALVGGQSTDQADGRGGDDTYTLFGGPDTIIKRPGQSDDVWTDFAPAEGDRIDIAAYGFRFRDVEFEVEDVGLRVLLGDDSILLKGFEGETLAPEDFIGLVPQCRAGGG